MSLWELVQVSRPIDIDRPPSLNLSYPEELLDKLARDSPHLAQAFHTPLYPFDTSFALLALRPILSSPTSSLSPSSLPC